VAARRSRSARARPRLISPAVASEVAGLPSTFHRDPADRIIVATARAAGAAVATIDNRIINSGLVDTIG
jgi:PIN domain nuclease of toxin-antitoxin system